jgi:hypothetical protein
MNWLERHAYNQEIGFLNRYLKSPADPYEYIHDVRKFLDHSGVDYDEEEFDDDEFGAGEKWLSQASQAEIAQFLEYAQAGSSDNDPYSRPVKETLSYNRLAKPGWLVHFTNDPWGIAHKGFIYGHEELEGLALTTWKTNESRHSYPGFNFALNPDSRDADFVARQGKYGKHAVIFWAAGVEAYHFGDEENQVIFWGPSVNRNMIFPIEKRDGEWTVSDGYGYVRKSGDFGDVVSWVEDNYRLLQQVQKRIENINQEKRREQEVGKMRSDELERFDKVIEP